jgi:hypothetical protein
MSTMDQEDMCPVSPPPPEEKLFPPSKKATWMREEKTIKHMLVSG